MVGTSCPTEAIAVGKFSRMNKRRRDKKIIRAAAKLEFQGMSSPTEAIAIGTSSSTKAIAVGKLSRRNKRLRANKISKASAKLEVQDMSKQKESSPPNVTRRSERLAQGAPVLYQCSESEESVTTTVPSIERLGKKARMFKRKRAALKYKGKMVDVVYIYRKEDSKYTSVEKMIVDPGCDNSEDGEDLPTNKIKLEPLFTVPIGGAYSRLDHHSARYVCIGLTKSPNNLD
jgi:hypothetical protein